MSDYEQRELPEGWAWTTLGEVLLDKSKSLNPKKMPDETFELYSVPSFQKNFPEICIGKEIGSTKRLVEEGTVLLCKINPRINRVWIVANHSKHKKIASTEWISFFRRDELESKYLSYFMQNYYFRNHLAANVSGVGGSLMRVKKSRFIDYPFPLAPLAEQRRIVAAIETLFTQLDAGVAALECAQRNLQRYKASVLKAACEGRLVPQNANDEPASALLQRILSEREAAWEAEELAKMEAKGKPPKNDKWKTKYKEPAGPEVAELMALPAGWVWARFDQIAEVMGGLTKNKKRADYTLQLPYLRVANVYANRLKLDEVKMIGVKETELERVLLKKQDILIVEGNGSIDQIGRVALWNGSISPCVHQNHLIKARPYFLELGRFVLYWLLSVGGREEIVRVASSTTGLHTLSLSKVSDLPIPLPPIAEQRRIVAEVEHHLSIIAQAETIIDTNLKRAARLRQSILKRAFAGKLVAQEVSDESASVLLTRIRAETAKVEKKKSKTKKKTRRKKTQASQATQDSFLLK